MSELRGIISPFTTPFDKNGLVDYSLVKPQVDWLINNGVHGLDISQHKRTFQIYYGDIVKKESKEWIDELSSTQVYHSILTYMG